MKLQNRPFLLIFLIILLSGCSIKEARLSTESPYYPLDSLKEGSILHVPTGTLISEDQLFSYSSGARIIYVGEVHDNLDHHKSQLAVIKALEQRYPGKVAVGMEMFRRPSQPILDKWVSGELDDKAFFKKWIKDWGFDYGYYKDILDYVRKKKIPLVALNASREQMRALMHKGVDEMDSEIGESLPEMDEGDPYHRAMIEAIYGEKSHGKGAFDRFYQMQLLWEETMARSIADFLKSADGEGMHMVVLAGGGHVEYGFGIPKRVFRQLPEPYTTILLTSPEVTGNEELVRKKGIKLLKVDLPEVPLYAADFVWSTGYERLEYDRPRLGVQLKEEDEKVKVVLVDPGSAAENGGIKAGDIIEELDGESVKDVSDLIYLIRLKEFGQKSTVTILRGEDIHEIEVHFVKKNEDQ
ncbi:MAG: ChaN family lipoprotein [Thermodesulfobacteriota bacterium]